MAEAAVKEKRDAAERGPSRAEAERELTDGFHLVIDALKLNGINTIYGVPGIPITDLGRMAQAAGIRVHLVPARAERRQCRGDRRLPDQEARHLPHGVGAGLPQRPDRARQRHHQLLSDDPDLAARPSARSSTCSRATTRRWTSSPSPSRCARRRSACCMPPTSASASRARSAPRCRAVRAASISTCRPSCSAR